VFRLSNRIGLTKAKTPLQSELQLVKHIPEEFIATAHHWLILHGRYICLARTPRCEVCPLTEWCRYFKTQVIREDAPHSIGKKTNPAAAKPAPGADKRVTVKRTAKDILKKVPIKK
jgi:endonuclease-3